MVHVALIRPENFGLYGLQDLDRSFNGFFLIVRPNQDGFGLWQQELGKTQLSLDIPICSLL